MAKKPNLLRAPSDTDALASDVLEGFRKHPKELSPVWFYDEFGSFLFDSICELPEYYITRTELEIMRVHAPEMARHIGGNAAIIELGSGTSLKTRTLLDHVEMPATYVPVDIAREHLLDAAGALARDYPDLRVIPLCADFTQTFELPAQLAAAAKRVVYFPGFDHRQLRIQAGAATARAHAQDHRSGRRGAHRSRSAQGSARAQARVRRRRGRHGGVQPECAATHEPRARRRFRSRCVRASRRVGGGQEPHRDAPGQQARPGRAYRR